MSGPVTLTIIFSPLRDDVRYMIKQNSTELSAQMEQTTTRISDNYLTHIFTFDLQLHDKTIVH